MRAEGHPGIDELLHVAIDEHDIAALAHGQRGLGLALEFGEVALAQRRRGSQRLQSLDLAYDLSVNVRRQSTCFNRQVFPNLAELASAMRNPAYAPNSRSGATIAHPRMTSRCHNGRDLRSTGIAPIRKRIPPATQSRPTAVGSGGE